MSLLSWFWLLCCFSISSLALHESDVGVIDWHKRLVGVPLTDTTATAPKFVDGLVVTATSSNVLAAISPADGSIVWRYIFDQDEPIQEFHDHDGTVSTLSGHGGIVFRQFNATTGTVLSERRISNDPSPVQPGLGKSLAVHADGQRVVALTNGHTVSESGSSWTWSSPDAGSSTTYFKVVSTSEAHYVIGATKSIASYTLHIVSLEPGTGRVIESRDIPSSFTNILLEANALVRGKHALALWVENGTLKTFTLNPTLFGKPVKTKFTNMVYVLDIGLSAHGQALAQNSDGTADVLEVSEAGAITALHKFDLKPIGLYFAGGVDERTGKAVFGRSYWAPELKKIVLNIVVDGESKDYTIPFDTDAEGVINHFTFRITTDGEPQVVTTASSGAIQAFNATSLQWTRQESLATATFAEFVELPERIAAESNAEGEDFVSRLIRHAIEAQNLPQYLSNFVRRFVTGSYASATSSAVPQSQGETLYRDTFGFRQVIVTATLYGKIFGLDSSSGKTLWSRTLGLGSAYHVGGVITPNKMFVLKTVSEGSYPEVVIVAERKGFDSTVATVLYHINALTGEDLTGSSSKPEFLEGVEFLKSTALDSFLLDGEKKTVIVLDESHNVHLYPDSAESQAAFKAVHSRLTFPTRVVTEGGHSKVVGRQLSLGDKPAAYATWTLSLPAGETVQQILPPATKGPIASLGKVLGNRTTLYKYLNPRLFTALTSSPGKNLCGLYVIDSAKGTVLYHREVRAHNSVCDIRASLVENWLTYHYYESEAADGTVGGTKGYRLVSVEFYEGYGPDDKTRSSELSAFSNASTALTAYEESFIFPHAITTLAPTSTKFGITSKDLIFATKNHKIQSFPRRYLDPRRPHRKPTNEELEEGLIQYDAIILDDPKRVISHNYEVANVKRSVTAPALLESTSLVFAFGLDMFLTRVAPSNTFDVLSENFNKAQLVITISGLALAILFTRPMVQRKRLKEKWYQ